MNFYKVITCRFLVLFESSSCQLCLVITYKSPFFSTCIKYSWILSLPISTLSSQIIWRINMIIFHFVVFFGNIWLPIFTKRGWMPLFAILLYFSARFCCQFLRKCALMSPPLEISWYARVGSYGVDVHDGVKLHVLYSSYVERGPGRGHISLVWNKPCPAKQTVDQEGEGGAHRAH